MIYTEGHLTLDLNQVQAMYYDHSTRGIMFVFTGDNKRWFAMTEGQYSRIAAAWKKSREPVREV